MKSRPISLTFLSIFLLGVALCLPLQVMWLYQHSLSEWSMILHKLTELNIIVIGVCLMNSYLAWLGDPWLKFTVPLQLALVTLNNVFVGNMGTDFSMLQTTIATIGFAGLHAVLLFTQANMVIGHPELRWWLIPQRRKMVLPVNIKNSHGVSLLRSHDISKTGMFVTPLSGVDSPLWKFAPGTVVDLTISSGLEGEINLKAQVVRNCYDSKGNYPKGVGLHFENISLWERLKLQRLMKRGSQFI